MTVDATCPVCGAPQSEGLLCHSDTTALERELGDVVAIVADLDIALSKQARIGNASGPGGLARERSPINVGAMNVADDLANTLTTWARDVGNPKTRVFRRGKELPPAAAAAAILLVCIAEIRRHPAVVELVDEITDAIRQARRAVDRPADRHFVGPCLSETPDDQGRQVTCLEDLYARPGASEVRCKICATEHPVEERQAWLIEQSRPRLFTVREASTFIAAYGEMQVNQKTIRTWIDRKQLITRPGPTDERYIVLGELLDLLADKATKAAERGVA